MSFVSFLGIDVSKNTFEVARHGAPSTGMTFQNSNEGFEKLLSAYDLLSTKTFVVLEATGGYEMSLLSFLVGKDIAVHRATPQTASHYARSLKLHLKTDRADAISLARYAAERHDCLPLFQFLDQETSDLKRLDALREDLVTTRAVFKNQMQAPGYKDHDFSLTTLQVLIDKLNEQISCVEEEMKKLIENSPSLKEKGNIIQSFKGVGPVVLTALLGSLPELGHVKRRTIAALAGLAPHPRESGKMVGYRSTRGGRSNVKKYLIIAALAARRYDPEMRAFYERLVMRGKSKMAAQVAVARKIVTRINGCLRDKLYSSKAA